MASHAVQPSGDAARGRSVGPGLRTRVVGRPSPNGRWQRRFWSGTRAEPPGPCPVAGGPCPGRPGRAALPYPGKGSSVGGPCSSPEPRSHVPRGGPRVERAHTDGRVSSSLPSPGPVLGGSGAQVGTGGRPQTVSRCRHAAIAKYFGDAPPACTKGCDHCQNPAAVRKQLDALERSSSWSKTCIGPSQGSGFDPELYEGGRRGYGGFSRYDEGSGGSGDEGRDEAHKREWNLFYQKQMSLRKGKDPKTEEFVAPDEDCPLKEASSRKIPRLTVKAREHCLRLLEEALGSNCQAAGAAQGPDLQAKAVELEHEMFRNAKAANLYKASVLKKVAEIHRTSKDGQLYGAKGCSAQAEPPEPSEHDVLPASQVYSLKPKRVGAGFPRGAPLFQTASQLMEEVRAGGQPRPEQEPPGLPRGLPDEESREPVPRPREAPGSSAPCGGPSPEKAKGPSGGSPAAKARASKRQQLLAAAARKDSQNIARFFCQRAEGPPAPAAAPGAEGASPSSAGVRVALAVAPETWTREEDGALGRSAAHPQTECTREGPSACPLRDPGPLEGQLSLPEGAPRGKRPRPQQENPESQARKRPPPSAGASVLAEANDNILAGQSATSRPAQGSCQPAAPGPALKAAANVVVQCLTPFYREGKFASKDLFKAFARHLSHALAQKPSPGRGVKEEAQHLIKQFFRGRARCESEADWHGLCDPQK